MQKNLLVVEGRHEMQKLRPILDESWCIISCNPDVPDPEEHKSSRYDNILVAIQWNTQYPQTLGRQRRYVRELREYLKPGCENNMVIL